MQITNVTGLPPAVFNLLSFAGYTPMGDISVTRLIKPVRIVQLEKRYNDQIKVDAQELAWSSLGQAAHAMLERSSGEGVIVEKRLHANIFGWDVNGQPDIWYPKTKEMHDYKITSVWAFVFADKPEWEQQLNLNAMLHRMAGQDVESIKIVAILRDWSMRKAQVERDYPNNQIIVVPQQLWTQDRCVDFAEERTALHQDASTLSDDALPLCTEKERWYRTGGWPVRKNGNKKADRVFGTKDEADRFVVSQTPLLKKGRFFDPVVEKKGENVRCIFYCSAAPFCDFGRQVKAAYESERIAKTSAPVAAESAEAVEPAEGEE